MLNASNLSIWKLREKIKRPNLGRSGERQREGMELRGPSVRAAKEEGARRKRDNGGGGAGGRDQKGEIVQILSHDPTFKTTLHI